MKSIQQLIETVFDETSIAPELHITLTEAGWCAKIVDEGMVLLCAAGEYFLVASGYETVEAALTELDRIAEQGFRLAAEYR